MLVLHVTLVKQIYTDSATLALPAIWRQNRQSFHCALDDALNSTAIQKQNHVSSKPETKLPKVSNHAKTYIQVASASR